MAGVDELTKKYLDLSTGKTHRHSIDYKDLSAYVKDKIAEADMDEHELLKLIVIQMKINNLHRAILSKHEITEKDIKWP